MRAKQGRRPAKLHVTIQDNSNQTTLADVFDRVLDKGIVVDTWVKVSLAGVDLLTLEARIVAASFETYIKCADPLSKISLVGIPRNRSAMSPRGSRALRSF